MLAAHDDDSLVRRLRDALRGDRAPRSVLEDARAAFSRRRTSPFARIIHDSRQSARRQPRHVRLLARSEAGTMSIELVHNHAWTLAVNSPDVELEAASVETPDEILTADVHTDGSFRVAGISPGALRIVVNAGTPREIHTEWVTL